MEACIICANLVDKSDANVSSCNKCFICLPCHQDLILAPETLLTCNCQKVIYPDIPENILPPEYEEKVYRTFLDYLHKQLFNLDLITKRLEQSMHQIKEKVPKELFKLLTRHRYLSKDMFNDKYPALLADVNIANEPNLKTLKLDLNQVKFISDNYKKAIRDFTYILASDLSSASRWYAKYKDKLPVLYNSLVLNRINIYQVYGYYEDPNNYDLNKLGFISHPYDDNTGNGVLSLGNDSLWCYSNYLPHGRCQIITMTSDTVLVNDEYYDRGNLISETNNIYKR